MRRPSFMEADRFGPLLILLLAMFVLGPALNRSRLGTVLLGVLVAFVLATALVASGVGGRRARLWTALGMVILASAGMATLTVDGSQPAWMSGLVATVLLVMTGLVLRRILQQETVTLSTVSGALCAYLMIGLAFGSVFRTVSTLDPEALTSPIVNDGTYYSFVTLTTLGYGDIAPVSDMARSLSVLEAVLGQVLLVVLVARFVGNLGQRRERPPRLPSSSGESGGSETTEVE